MKGVFASFVELALAVTVVCLIMIVVTGNFLPLILLVSVVWALFCVACGLAEDD